MDISDYDVIGQAFLESRTVVAQSGGSNPYLQLLRALLPKPLQLLRVLDAGCGGGDGLRRLQQWGIPDVYGVDVSQCMVDAARAQVADPERVQRCSIERLPFASNHFDVVILEFTLHYLPRFEVAFQELGRVLRPGGALLLATPHPLMQLLLQTQSKQYGAQEVVASRLVNAPLTLHAPSHTLSAYLSPALFKNFVVDGAFEFGQFEAEDGLRVPRNFMMRAIRRNA